jgi:polar amino acid transport system permease protein
MNAEWRWDFAFEILPNMLWATLNTILAAGIGYAIAAIVGLLFLLGQRTPIKIVNMFNREIVEFIRSTPLLNSVIFCLFRATSVWYYFISVGMRNDYYRFTFWNIFI